MTNFFSSRDRVTEDLPKLKREARAEVRRRLVHSLNAARIHLNVIRHNPLAVERQENIITQREQALVQFDNEEFLQC